MPIEDELAKFLQDHRERRLGPILPAREPQWEQDPWEPAPETSEGTSQGDGS